MQNCRTSTTSRVMCIWCKLCVFVVPSFRCKSGVWVNSVYKVYILSCNFGVPRVSCTWYKLRIFVVPSSKCILLLHIGIFAMYFTLRTLPIPRGLHQSGTCKRGVKFALVVYLMLFGVCLKFCSQIANKS